MDALKTDISLAHDAAGEQQLRPLQEILLPMDKTITDLYLRVPEGYVEADECHLLMERKSKVSFNTYFNSFYESYWVDCTVIPDLYLSVEFSGSILVEVFRDTKNHGCHRVEWKTLSSDEAASKTIRIPLFREGGLGEAGRLFVDITAKTRTTISALAFQTSRAPEHVPTVTLGICTYNREVFLYRNLEAILSYKGVIQSIEKIIVVNQGPSFANPALVKLIDHSDKIKLIEQRNLGGCGGFTRTMHECLEFQTATHHVLMDDDASIDARILKNLESFLSYASQDIVVGGHMLDLLRPWVLYEAGAIVQPNSRLRSLHHNIDLRELSSLQAFNRCHYSDYNAWWFCAIPTKHIEEAQFPAPIFIRGDDMEYGIRLQEKGVKTVAMPGIAVWHEPFYVKVGGWQIYYDLRNRLILASAYPHRFTLESPKIVLWMMMQALAMHDYMTAQLLCKAVTDFLKGPSLFETDAEAIHKEVASLSKSLNQESVATTEGLQKLKTKSMPKSELRIAWLLTKKIVQALLFGSHDKNPVLLMDNQATVINIPSRPYVKTNGIGSYKLLYRPDRTKLRQTLGLCFSVYRRYKAERGGVAQSWHENIVRLRSSEHWKGVFDEADVG